jgi:hypothetical protein
MEIPKLNIENGLQVCFAAPFFMAAAFALGWMFYYWYLSWFDPQQLRYVEEKRIQIMPRLFKKRLARWRIEQVQKEWWLWGIRVLTTLGLLPFLGVAIFIFLGLIGIIR